MCFSPRSVVDHPGILWRHGWLTPHFDRVLEDAEGLVQILARKVIPLGPAFGKITPSVGYFDAVDRIAGGLNFPLDLDRIAAPVIEDHEFGIDLDREIDHRDADRAVAASIAFLCRRARREIGGLH